MKTPDRPGDEPHAMRDFPVVLLRDGRVVEPSSEVHARPPRRRLRWVGAGLALACGGALWWVTTADTDRPARPKPTAAVLSAPALALPNGPTVVATSGARPTPAEDGSIELCGLGRLSAAQREDVDAWFDRLREPVERTMTRTIAALAAQSDERSRAMAIVLRGLRGADAAAASAGCEKEPCDDAVAVESARWAATQDELARMASTTSDPAVYALALQACQSVRSQQRAFCQTVSAARLAQLDPDNAMVWLQVADEARARSDPAAFDEAIYRASKASRNELGFARMTRVVLAQVPADAPPIAAWGMAVSVIGWEAARAIPGYLHLSTHCAAPALADPNRRQVCNDLANVLVERGDSPIDRNIGASVGRRLGWSAERLATIDEERDAINAVQTKAGQASMPFGMPTTCPAVEADLQRVSDMARYGELGVLRRELDRSGVDRATLAARHRQSMAAARRAETASAAASAATGPL